MSHTRQVIVFVGALLLLGCNSSPPRADSTPAVAATAPARHAGDNPNAQREPETDAAPHAKSGGLKIFVSNYEDDTISVVEGNPLQETKVFHSGASPDGMAVRPTEPRLLAVANSTEFGVSFYDVNTYREIAKLDDITRGPDQVKFSPDGKWLYVVGPLDRDLSFIDVDAMKEVGDPLTFGDDKRPSRVIVSDDGSRLYVLVVDFVGNGEGAEVAVVDAKTREILKRIPVGRQPKAMAIGNHGRTLVTASFDDSTLTVIDVPSLEVIKTMDSETGFGLAVHPTKPIAYTMASFDDEFHVMDLESGATIKTISAGQWPTYCAFGPGGRYLYIPHEESDSLVKFDTETNTVVMKIAVGKEPAEVAFYQP